MFDRIAAVASAGGLCGARGLTGPVADALEAAIRLVPTEASAQAVRAFRGGAGLTSIRGGRRSFELTTVASVTFYLDVARSVEAAGPLARAVMDAESLEEANGRLGSLGVRTELDLERDLAERQRNEAAGGSAGGLMQGWFRIAERTLHGCGQEGDRPVRRSTPPSLVCKAAVRRRRVVPRTQYRTNDAGCVGHPGVASLEPDAELRHDSRA